MIQLQCNQNIKLEIIVCLFVCGKTAALLKKCHMKLLQQYVVMACYTKNRASKDKIYVTDVSYLSPIFCSIPQLGNQQLCQRLTTFKFGIKFDFYLI